MENALGDYLGRNRAQTISESDPFTGNRYRQFVRHLPRQSRNLLDVGCNTGRGGREIKAIRPELQVSGLDVVPERVEALDPSVYFEGRVGLATELPWPDESFDALVAGEFIEHVNPTEVEGVLAEFFRVLTIGGYAMLTTPNPNDLKRRLRGRTVLGGAHVSQHHPKVLAHRMKAAGFGTTRIYGSGKTSRFVGQWRVFSVVCGSYLIVARKF